VELLEDCIATDQPLLECQTNANMSQKNYAKVWDDNPSSYFQDMEKLFTSGKFSDVKIVCGNETFLCHKNILATRSDVFAAMFDMTGSTENQTGVVQVDDFDAKTMKILLAYIYGNNIDRKDGDMDLLLAADKYNLPGLVKSCEFALISELSLNNA
jgi:speckle-type POZ protein